ncbi:hypothetical protein J6590_017834 [Homalodisca vitripennis]|nr:hypothetical protein J6590_017834 [Homalodisca vitripennis]
MGQEPSKTRKIHVENPEPPDIHVVEESCDEGKANKKEPQVVSQEKKIPQKRLAFMPRFHSTEGNMGDLRVPFLRNHVPNGTPTAIGFGKEEFERMYQDVERYFTFTSENTLRDYEVPCKVIKGALKECLTLHNQQPLHCGEEVSNFVTCLLKCKLSQQT